MNPWGGKGGDGGGPWGKPSNSNQGGGQNNPQPPDIDEILRRSQDTFRRVFGGGNGGGGGGDFGRGESKRGMIFLIVAGVLVWFASGIYFVKADEQGVVMRFGQYHRTAPSGLNYHLPYPIETALVPKVTAINKVEVGFRSYSSRRGDNAVEEESLMLTGDENIVDINFEVQWRILNAPDFLFNIRNPEESVKAVSESAMREVVGQSQISTILAEGKLQVEQSTQKLIQEVLNSYNAGIEVVSVNLLKADPPAQVIDSFRDVQTARADMETERNKAEAYRNDILPRARGQAEQLLQEAEAYRQQVIADAKGQASRFASIYQEYKLAKDVTRKRMYIETMEDIMQGMNKVIVDDGAQNVVPYLPLPEVRNRQQKEAAQ